MADFLTISLTVLPVFLLLLSGTALHRLRVFDPAFWAGSSRLVYYVLVPSLFVLETSRADFSQASAGLLILTLLATLMVATVVLLALRPLLGVSGSDFPSIYQGIVRFNTFIGLPISQALMGPEGVTAAAVAITTIASFTNIAAVLIHARFAASAGPVTPLAAATSVFSNPFLIGIAVGLVLNATGLGLPPVADSMVELLARAALPIGLLTAGAGLRLDLPRQGWTAMLSVVALRLSIMPLLAAGIATLLGLSGTGFQTAVLYSGLPCAVASYVLAQQMGGNAVLMAAIIAGQTCLAILSLPILLLLVGAG